MINESTRLLVICPTRNRPHRLIQMLESFDATKSEGTEIIIYISEDDPCLGQYREVVKNRNYVIGKRKHLVEVLNYISCALYPKITYYGEVNDDHIYRTKGWDNALIEAIETRGDGWGVACGADSPNVNWIDSRHPSACIISGNIVRELGFFVLPLLQHHHTDVYLRDMAEGIDRLLFCRHVITEHMHFKANKSTIDDNYKWVYSKDQVVFATKTYNNWKMEHYPALINKLRRKIEECLSK